jgi:hypothetical protein
MNINIRNIDPAAIAKITALAKKKKMSREKYLRTYIESLAVLGELKMLENKYSSLVSSVTEAVEHNTEELTKLRLAVENQTK